MWLRYLIYEGTEDRELTDFIRNDSDIKKAHEQYEEFLSDEHLQHLYLAREMYRHDEATRIATAAEKGRKEIISRMIAKGYSISQISEMTDLPEAEIHSLME